MSTEKNYEEICYDKNFLKEVILRVDFSSPLSKLIKKIPSKLRSTALSNFPIFEPQQVQSQAIQISPSGELAANSHEETQWNFYGNGREKNILIAPKCIALSTREYRTYEKLTSEFFKVFDVLKNIEPELIMSRIGLRYVNVIELQDGDALDWRGYVEGELLKIIHFNKWQKSLSRVFHVMEYNFDKINLKCQFGIVNPDYPAIIKRRQFVLDLDAYSVAVNDVNELSKVVSESHKFIQEFFEESIGEKTREKMKKVNHEKKAE